VLYIRVSMSVELREAS